MEYITVIGLVAGTRTCLSLVPQLLKSLKTKSTKDISAGTYIVLSTGVFLWLVYGILKLDIPLIVANAVNLVLVLGILILKMKYG